MRQFEGLVVVKYRHVGLLWPVVINFCRVNLLSEQGRASNGFGAKQRSILDQWSGFDLFDNLRHLPLALHQDFFLLNILNVIRQIFVLFLVLLGYFFHLFFPEDQILLQDIAKFLSLIFQEVLVHCEVLCEDWKAVTGAICSCIRPYQVFNILDAMVNLVQFSENLRRQALNCRVLLLNLFLLEWLECL